MRENKKVIVKIIILIFFIFGIYNLLSNNFFYKNKEEFISCSPKKPDFDDKVWNNNDYKKYNNCYSYALNEPDNSLKSKRDPGISSNIKKDHKIYNCNYFEKLLKSDYPDIVKTKDFNSCPCNKDYKMISMVIADGKTPFIGDKNDDYHFYRLDKNNKWSHKPGSRDVSLLDADGKIINDPREANHYYRENNRGSKNYNNFCGYYCI